MAAEGNWQKVDEIYRLALQQEPGRREEFLREACAGDATLRAEVESLLGYDDKAGSFLEPPEDPGPAHSMAEGETFAHYRIIEKLGRGGMGVVYKARDTRLNRLVAIKMLPRRLMALPERRARFVQEARAASALNHPHIVTIYDIGEADGRHFIAMEYVEGSTLEKLIPRKGMRVADALRYAIQIADALTRTHGAGVIHRDLKPSNIMVTPDGQVKIVDFGLAKVRYAQAVAEMSAPPTETTPLTSEGTLLGTLQYMAPEQLEGEEVDARTDIFAFGAIIYEMTTGRKAFEGKTQASLISAIMTSEPPSLSTFVPVAPPPLEHLVRTCLAKSPAMRWQTTQDVLLQLKWIIDAESQGGLPKLVATRTSIRVLFSWLVTAIACLIVLVLSFVRFHQATPQSRSIRFSISPPEKVIFGDLEGAGPVLVSPDGSRLAFVGIDDAGKSQLWIRALDALEAQPLTAMPKAKFPYWSPDYPFWSPDSRYLAFFADGKLKKIPVDGGPSQILCDAPNPRGGAWGKAADGRGVIVFAPRALSGLSRVKVSGGEPVPVTELDASRQEISHRQPEFLPDGRHFLYVALSDKPENHGIFIGDIQAKPDPRNVRRLMSGTSHVAYAPPGYLLYLRENKLLAQSFDVQRLELSGEPFVIADHVAGGPSRNASDFSVSVNGVLAWRTQSAVTRQLAWFDRGGHQVDGLDSREPYVYPDLSSDGRSIAASRPDAVTSRVFNIWLLDSIRSSASRFTYGPGFHMFPVWSPDGLRIVFSTERPPEYGLYWKELRGAQNEELLLRTPKYVAPTDWSKDGRFILFSQEDPKAKLEVWVLPLFGERKPVPVLQTAFNEGWARLSPDNRWMAYFSDETGRYEVYVRSFIEGGAVVKPSKWQISTAGGTCPRWRGDGRELFFIALDGKLMAVPVKTGSDFTARVPVALFDTRDAGFPGFALRSDGQRFLISRSLKLVGSESVNICLNWLDALKK